jgi:hypothetical protein
MPPILADEVLKVRSCLEGFEKQDRALPQVVRIGFNLTA